MKPISLKISGLNSFIEPAVIDFTQLTERGIFGIFGPTGSGKSTILDAMTLALYGDIPRNTKNYINANSKTATVAFDFQISGKEAKQYRVEREFKRESNGQNARTSKARLIDMTNNQVLEEKTTAINEQCTQIIGLSKEDFGRTVVLPQGKFSEFLKLEGSKKREMLERLFNLGQYGDELNTKVNKQAADLKSQKDNLEGYLASYKDLEKIDLTALEKEIKNDEKKANQQEITLKTEEETFNELKNQWEKQQELDKKRQELSNLEQNKEEYKSLENLLAKAKQAKEHIPYIKNYETLVTENNNLENTIKHSKIKLNQITQKEIEEKEILVKQEKQISQKLEKVKNQENLVKSLLVNLEGRNHLQEAENLKSRIKLGSETIENELNQKTQYEKSLKLQEKTYEDLETKIKTYDKILDKIEEKLIANEHQKEKWQQSQMAKALSQTLSQGQDCPICGNKIQNLISKTKEKAWAAIEEEKKTLQLEKQKQEKDLNQIKQEKAKLKGQSETLKEALDKTLENIEKYGLTLAKIKQGHSKALDLAAKALEYKGDIKNWDSTLTLEQIKQKENLKLKEEQNLENIRTAYENAQKLYSDANQSHQNILLEKAKLETTTIELSKNLSEIKTKLEQSIKDLENSFKQQFSQINIDKAKQDFIPQNQQETMENQIGQYKKQLEQLTGIIQNLETQIKTKLKIEQYQEALESLNQRKHSLNNLKEKLLLNKKTLDQTQNRIKEQKIALENLGKISHKLGLVEELKKLFAGKRFVSYVAKNQLKLIAREASKRLMDITGGSYELQVDEDGKFQIIDYKNGATIREVSSLSGGEVFIASLALALALASHIQLKGANLELFFLDEGFGTLDEELLEIVMNSIEKIKSDNLAIGLISHVESIKQRVPIKLIVSPAQSGGIGSKVQIEY